MPPPWETPLNIKSKSISVYCLRRCRSVALRVEEFLSQLLIYLGASGEKLNRTPTEHASPSVISEDGFLCQLIHLFSLASLSTTAERRRNPVESPMHKPMRCFLRKTMLIKQTSPPLITGNQNVDYITRWVLGVVIPKYLPFTLNCLWDHRGDLHKTGEAPDTERK